MLVNIQRLNQLLPHITSGAIQPLGELLVALEDMVRALSAAPSEPPPPLLLLTQNLRRLTEDIIMEQGIDSSQALSALRQGIILAVQIDRGQMDKVAWDKFQMLQMRLALAQGQGENASVQAPGVPRLSDEDILLAREFVNEAQEHLEGIEIDVLALEKRPEDLTLVNAIFRPFHTIKGVSGFLNFTDINQLAHDLENVLDLVRQRQVRFERYIVDITLEGVDIIRNMLDNVGQAIARQEFPTALTVDNFREKIAHALQRSRRKTPRLRLGEVVIYKNLVSPQSVAKALVAQKTKYPDQPLGQVLVLMGFLQPHELDRALGAQQENTTLDVQRRQVKIEADKIENLVNSLDALVKLQNNFSAGNGVQEQQNKLLQEALAAALAMARVPIGPVFNKMNRLVRDLADKQEKQVRLKLEGPEVEVDRNLAERIYDPLLHMVRNSLDHGIETPVQRRRSGKPAMGTITLGAALRDNTLCISVGDDGQGLNHEKIKARLEARGALPTGQISEQQLFACLFEAGFSTADVITDISGRGVGLDVVKSTIEQLGGEIKIISTPGQGSTFQFYFTAY